MVMRVGGESRGETSGTKWRSIQGPTCYSHGSQDSTQRKEPGISHVHVRILRLRGSASPMHYKHMHSCIVVCTVRCECSL